MEKRFRWGIIGASSIANKFCDAISGMEGCVITAIGSRSLQRAQVFAENNHIDAAYGSYEEMLDKERPDAVYIAVVTGEHYNACMLCLKYRIPFLCEKTMCVNSAQVRDIFMRAEQEKIFCMEAMWCRFLPIVKKAKRWCSDGKIGDIKYVDASLGFCALKDENNRFWNKKLGGGASYDLLVYGYEIIRFLIEEPIKKQSFSQVMSRSGVDASDLLILYYDDKFAVIRASFETCFSQGISINGEKGKVEIPDLLFGNKVICTQFENGHTEEYTDEKIGNGFVYEIEEVMTCIAEGKLESETVSHELTLEFAEICDEIQNGNGECKA